jgi:lipopolysaccharide export system protein LptA
MKRTLCLLLTLGVGALVWAQTEPAPPAASKSEVDLHAQHFYFDGNARQAVFYGQVQVTNSQGQLYCERLTINLPPQDAADSHPTNAVAETNVFIIIVNKGETNHIASDKAIYDYGVHNGVTNETYTFTGHASNTNITQGWWVTGEPLIWDNIGGRISGSDTHIHFLQSAKGSNAPGYKVFGN